MLTLQLIPGGGTTTLLTLTFQVHNFLLDLLELGIWTFYQCTFLQFIIKKYTIYGPGDSE